MLRPDTLLTLRNYTSLPGAVQGTLQLSDGAYELGRFVTSGGEGFDRVLRRTFDDTVTLSSMRLLSGPGDEGERLQGPFVLRGSVYSTPSADNGGSLAIGRIVRGRLPPGSTVSSGGEVLVSFEERDRLPDERGGVLYFAASTTSGPLAPEYAYVAPLLARRMTRAIVACPNGLFLLRALPTPAASEGLAARHEALDTDAGDDAGVLVRNLLQVEWLASVGDDRAVVYRLAENCLLAAGPGFEPELRRMQAAMRLPLSLRTGLLPATSTAIAPRISATVLDAMTGFRVTEDAVRQLSRPWPDTRVESQPLLVWLRPLSLRLRLVPAVGASSSSSLALAAPAEGVRLSLQVDGSEAGASVSAETVGLRLPRRTETAADLQETLRSLFEQETRRVLDGPSVFSSQAALDAAASTLSRTLQAAAARSGLFEQPMAADVSLRLERTDGERARLPSGGHVTLPPYALSIGPRLGAYLATLGALGVACDFVPWQAASSGLFVPTA